ncbi:imidazole glycerol phosphate synthase subunit HisH [Aliidiomarina taiwanensis]|uniref:Imidazole glycerol phosphate synthase subunit HisH n=1 Tax=Aliidiomarina taiwanensis TaxID=946228 RepID=A0A432X994_9GAMM|nr:imidazole glycerol phosphate synthase subunit HisH [Aliidiomarina taiwanensis]RUO43957.1 imidazole glycerol phosphate synthase subunit HisH [Aliidiomarina taiwanensis]
MLAIINTGCANINSVRFAFERLGQSPAVITAPEQLARYDRAILPGVGHAAIAIERLQALGWQQTLLDYERPLLGICLGMQLLCEHSAEGQVSCLGKIPGQVQALDVGPLPSPHMGWNTIQLQQEHPLTQGLRPQEHLYFVHSFAHSTNTATLAQCHYGERFSAIVAKDNVAGMQFHPERSAHVGARLLQNFINWQP